MHSDFQTSFVTFPYKSSRQPAYPTIKSKMFYPDDASFQGEDLPFLCCQFYDEPQQTPKPETELPKFHPITSLANELQKSIWNSVTHLKFLVSVFPSFHLSTPKFTRSANITDHNCSTNIIPNAHPHIPPYLPYHKPQHPPHLPHIPHLLRLPSCTLLLMAPTPTNQQSILLTNLTRSFRHRPRKIIAQTRNIPIYITMPSRIWKSGTRIHVVELSIQEGK